MRKLSSTCPGSRPSRRGNAATSLPMAALAALICLADLAQANVITDWAARATALASQSLIGTQEPSPSRPPGRRVNGNSPSSTLRCLARSTRSSGATDHTWLTSPRPRRRRRKRRQRRRPVLGVQNLDAGLIKTSRSFGGTDAQIFRTLALPGSVPFILAGLRLGVGNALIGVVVGELVAAQAGVGLMMAKAGATFQTSKVFAGLIIVAGTGIVLTGILQRIERRFQAWKPQNNA
jgi:hypothetical protein